jgi:GntR family transcriptional regulator
VFVQVEGLKSQRLYVFLQDAISRGNLQPGQRLPGENELAQQFGVSRVTVRRALAALADQGLVVRKPGVGTVVQIPSASSSIITADVSNLLPHIVRMGKDSQVQMLEFAYVPATPYVAEKLGLVTGERVQYSVRVRSRAGEPFSYLTTYVPERIAQNYSEADLARTPLYALLERSGVKVHRATQTISAVLASPVVSEALQLTPGSPLIALTRVVFGEKDRGVELLEALYRPDRYRIQVDLERDRGRDDQFWKPIRGKGGLRVNTARASRVVKN